MELSNILTIIYQSYKGFTLKKITLSTDNICGSNTLYFTWKRSSISCLLGYRNSRGSIHKIRNRLRKRPYIVKQSVVWISSLPLPLRFNNNFFIN